MDNTELLEKVKIIQDRDRLPSDHELVFLANEFNDATNGYFSENQTHSIKQFMGAWARARKAYCEYTREPLV